MKEENKGVEENEEEEEGSVCEGKWESGQVGKGLEKVEFQDRVEASLGISLKPRDSLKVVSYSPCLWAQS